MQAPPLPCEKCGHPHPGENCVGKRLYLFEPGQAVVTGRRIRRNGPCPCGSGKKFKHCHAQAGQFLVLKARSKS